MKDARDTFAFRSDAYAVSRPRYPSDLYDWILAACPGRESAWDCATGNGQAAADLAPHFARIQASDISGEQVAHGERAPNIRYSVEPAENTSYGDNSFDLVVVAQALHWFDYDLFWPEVSRVAKPGALFCAWGYAWFESDPDVDAALVEPFRAAIRPYWAANNAILWRGYDRDEIRFPYPALQTPDTVIGVDWTLGQLVGYMETWSATKRARSQRDVGETLERIVGSAIDRFGGDRPLNVRMPLALVAGRVEKA